MAKNMNPNTQNMQNRNDKTGFQAGQKNVQDKESFTHKAGDAIERAGQAIKGAGAEKIGNAVYKAGNKIEHSGDKK